MCKSKSGLILKDGSIIISNNTDSHSDLLYDNNIKDDTIDPTKKTFVRFECSPCGDLLDFDSYELNIDEEVIPTWFTGYKRSNAYVKIIQWLKDNITLTFNHNVYLNDTKITSLPDNLIINGSLYLGHTSITSLPKNLTINNTLYSYDNNIKSLPWSLKAYNICTDIGWFDGTIFGKLSFNLINYFKRIK